jgi:hypothetical protein
MTLAVDAGGHYFSVRGSTVQSLPGTLTLSMTGIADKRLGSGVGAFAFAPDGWAN